MIGRQTDIVYPHLVPKAHGVKATKARMSLAVPKPSFAQRVKTIVDNVPCTCVPGTGLTAL